MTHLDINLDDYAQQVRRFAIERDGALFLNSGAGCAKVVLSTLFDQAKERLDLYSGGLDSAIYKERMFDRLIDEKNIAPENIRVVVSDGTPDSHNVDLVRYLKSRGITVRSFAETGGHIAIADQSMYRFEYDHGEKQAICSFGRKGEQSSKLTEFSAAFSSIWNSATNYDIAN